MSEPAQDTAKESELITPLSSIRVPESIAEANRFAFALRDRNKKEEDRDVEILENDSKLPLIERLPNDVIESGDWLSNAFPIVEEDNGALYPFDLADIFPQPVETIPNTNTNNLVALASPQTTTTSLGKHALASAEVAAVTTIAETTATATKKTTTKPLKKVTKSEVKKSVREKARRDALNDRFEDLSRSLLESADDELKTDKLSIVIAARECILVLREQLGKLNACLAAERSEWAKTKQELIAEKILVEQKLQNFMAKMPFASAIPSTGGSKHAAANVGITGTVVTEDTDGDAPLAPILVVSTTTAEEDAKWRAPLA